MTQEYESVMIRKNRGFCMKNITIIGAGLGGLTAGALLSKKGHKVTLLEQHNIVGGCATTFKRKGGFICEVGLHEMDGVYTNPTVIKIFNELDVYNHVTFVKANEFFEVRTKNGLFRMPDGLDKAQKVLIDKFPQEKNAIIRYFKMITTLGTKLETLQDASWYHYAFFPFLFAEILWYTSKSVSDVFNKLFKDEAVKLILNSNVQYYNDSPDTLSFLLHAVAQHSYYKGGGYFIKGGSGRLSEYLASIIKENGGEIITSAMVTSCTHNVVEYLHKHKNNTLNSDEVVSNLSPEQTYRLYHEPYREKKQYGNSLLTIYLGFSQNLKKVYGERAYSNFIFDNISTMDDFNKMIQKDILEKAFIFVDYAQLDAALTKDENKSYGVITMIDDIKDWEELTTEQYQEKKEKLIEVTVKKLEKYYPNISNIIEYAEVGTAKTVKRYIKTPNGTAYGFKPTPKDFFRIPEVKSKKVKNLYFVGQWIVAGGFSPSIVSGYMCAKKL